MSVSLCIIAIIVVGSGLVGPQGKGQPSPSARRVECGDWAAKEEVSKKKKQKRK